MSEKFDKFIPNENKESKKEESLSEKYEILNPVCEICGKGHKTSQHSAYEAERQTSQEVLNKCEICGGSHRTSLHDEIMKKSEEPKEK